MQVGASLRLQALANSVIAAYAVGGEGDEASRSQLSVEVAAMQLFTLVGAVLDARECRQCCTLDGRATLVACMTRTVPPAAAQLSPAAGAACLPTALPRTAPSPKRNRPPRAWSRAPALLSSMPGRLCVTTTRPPWTGCERGC